uniref:Uncharacterized protein n=1 Tax=Anopheles quadriannulatus TaxID=34691 RepID=A0A182XQ93_ANOQN
MLPGIQTVYQPVHVAIGYTLRFHCCEESCLLVDTLTVPSCARPLQYT